MNRRRQRGFTLIELMVALVVSSLLAGMILAIFSRMSTAYRGQQQIAGVQQVLAAARATIELDARQAGLAMAQGFKLAGDASPPALQSTMHSPISIINNNDGPDELALFYADPTNQAVVTAVVGAWDGTPSVTVDPAVDFLPGDLVVLSTADLTKDNPINPAGAHLATYDACVLQIVTPGGIAGATVTFSTVAPWGVAGSAHCKPPTPGKTMMYRFVAHAYRIDPDPARTAQGPLQRSLTGGLIGTAADGWTDLAYGFTDLQTALELYDGDGIDTLDPDIDGNRDWYSGERQEELTQPIATALAYAPPLEVSISLVARTDRDVEGIATQETPDLIVPGNPDNNPIGDHPKVTLPWAIDPTLPGRIYRSTTFQVDLRNLGVGR
jgi:prepilin-type N-terminal cleavage/methylation domain-containing protein